MNKEKVERQNKIIPRRGVLSQFIKFWGSIKISLVLFAVVIIASVIGTLIPQNESAQVYIQHYGIPLYQLFRITGIIDLYNSWWFIVILFLLGLSSAVCTYNRYTVLRRFLGEPQMIVSDSLIKGAKTSIQVTVKAEIPQVGSRLLHQFEQSGYRVKSRTADDKTYIFGEQGILNRWGNLGVHISIVIILLGAIFGRFGFNHNLTIVEGDTAEVTTPSPPWILTAFRLVHSLGINYEPKQQADFRLHLNKFEVETYPNSRQPKDFRSFITVMKNGQPLMDRVVRVNYPLSFEGITFYQNSYGETGMVKSLTITILDSQTKKEVGTFPIDIGKQIAIPGQNIQVKLAKFIPDFTMDLVTKQPTTKSNELNNPATLIEEYEGDKLVGSTWVFAKFPEFHATGKTQFNYQLVDVQFKLYSVLQAGKDPGIPLIYAGFIILILGLLFSLFLEHRRVWVLLNATPKGTEVRLAGASNRRVHQMMKELEKLTQELDK